MATTVTINDTALKIGDTPTVTFSFDTAATLTARDIDLSQANGTLGTLTSNAAGTVWTAVFTPSADIED